MGKTLLLNPLKKSKFNHIDTIHEFQIVQNPVCARESAFVTNGSTQKLQKRLIQPFPVLSLRVYDASSLESITEHVICQFFVKCSVVCNNGTDDYSNILVGNSSISPSLFPGEANFPGFFAFKFSELGILRKGFFKLRFDLFKLDTYSDSSKLVHLRSVELPTIKVYGSKEFYRKDINMAISRAINDEKARFQNELPYICNVLRASHYITPPNLRDEIEEDASLLRMIERYPDPQGQMMADPMNLVDSLIQFQTQSLNSPQQFATPQNSDFRTVYMNPAGPSPETPYEGFPPSHYLYPPFQE